MVLQLLAIGLCTSKPPFHHPDETPLANAAKICRNNPSCESTHTRITSNLPLLEYKPRLSHSSKVYSGVLNSVIMPCAGHLQTTAPTSEVDALCDCR